MQIVGIPTTSSTKGVLFESNWEQWAKLIAKLFTGRALNDLRPIGGGTHDSRMRHYEKEPMGELTEKETIAFHKG